jgi:hypothetical protein
MRHHGMERRVLRVTWALGLPVLLATAGAEAGGTATLRPAPVRLVYVRGAGADHCPDAAALRAAVAARLGYEPFQEDAPTLIVATLSRRGRGLRAQIELRDPTGEITGAREITSEQNDCAELASAATLAISIAVDPLSATRPPPAAPPPPQPEPATPPAPAKPPELATPSSSEATPVPVRKRPAPVVFRVGLGAVGALGAAPAPALGGIVDASARWRSLSLGLEGRVDAPAGMQVPGASGGKVSAMLLLGTLAPCFHYRAVAGCGLISAGALLGSNEGGGRSIRATTPFVALGGRFGVEVPIVAALSARAHVDILGTATPTTLDADGSAVWRTPPVNGALGAGLLWTFP